MQENRLRKCIPLKIAVHIVMAFSFAAVIVCLILFWVSMDVRRNRLFENTERQDNGFFSSDMFLKRYGEQLDKLYDGLKIIGMGENNGYPLSAYVEADKNFKYGVYDVDGEKMYGSAGWDDKDIQIGEGRFYYTVDLCDMHLFPSDSIRRTGFKQSLKTLIVPNGKEDILQETLDGTAAEENRTEETLDGTNGTESGPNDTAVNGGDMEVPETFTAPADLDEKYKNTAIYPTGEENDLDDEGYLTGVIEYGSNFTKYTSFYAFNETELAKYVGYICTYVPEKLVEGDAFYDDYMLYNQRVQWGKWAVIGGSMALLVMCVCLVYLLMSAGYSHKSKTVQLIFFDKLYTEVSAAAILLALAMCISLIMEGINVKNSGLIVCALAPAYTVGVFGILSFARRIKARTLIKNALVYKIGSGAYEVIYNGFINNHLLRKYIAVIFGLGILDFILMFTVFGFASIWWTIFVMILYAYEFIYVGRKLMHIQVIKEGAQKISSGDLEYKIDTSEMSGVFREFAEDINNIGNGLNAAVDESIKSERMKADLITNVSHDIKTPLTSIINYVDLLKRENITEEPIREYIEVLDMKSQRLKALTEDLVEASRASSGNIKLEKTHINFVELVSQVAGTYTEKLDSKGIEMKLQYQQQVMMILADGRRLYRVLDNLFNNAFKYSMENSRIYIDMYVQGTKAFFVMKNISNAPLNISPEELTQRFVRGDASRTTEGSGLGLSIARSLTELHGGTFDIYLDGDLFKVTLMFEISPQV